MVYKLLDHRFRSQMVTDIRMVILTLLFEVKKVYEYMRYFKDNMSLDPAKRNLKGQIIESEGK